MLRHRNQTQYIVKLYYENLCKKGDWAMAKVNMENVAFHLLTSPTYAEAATRANISESTLFRLRKKPDFHEVLNKLKKEMFSETMQKAQSYSKEMLEVLRTIALDEKATDSSRVSAAKGILELGVQLRSMEEIEAKLLELEKVVMSSEVN